MRHLAPAVTKPRRAIHDHYFRAHCARLCLLLLALVTLIHTGPARAGALSQGDWLLRGLVLGSHASQVHSTISTIGGEVEIASRVQPGADLSYFLSERWALQFTGGISRTHYRVRDSLIGDFDVGRVDSYSGALSLQYHFTPWGALTPYLGAGLYHARERRVEPATGIPDFSVEPVTGPLLVAGADYHVSGDWFVSASLHYLKVPTYRFEGEGFSSELRANIWTLGAGLGYRF
ncbi:OmpW family protein [Salinicola sp. DM10]|uniref:OmpW/AlkL family protein n=1 Tax=Salinicola sp. DM10 TaxID=2815721 RepID=UPI001A8DCBFE|nr:OmpW family outer membrane protein [Salinicola sp. DM10]MCE3026909.1 outer membrane beta-barrel protein [Salinicola sp. DM10]